MGDLEEELSFTKEHAPSVKRNRSTVTFLNMDFLIALLQPIANLC